MNPNISPHVEAVLLQALSKAPADRYQSATALVAALHDAFDGHAPVVNESDTQPLEIPPPRTPPRQPKPASVPIKQPRRRFWLWAGWIIATGSAGAMVAVLVSVLISPNRLNSTPPPPQPPRAALYDVPVLSVGDASAQLRSNLDDPVAYLALVRAQLAADDIDGVRRSLAEGLEAGSEDARFELTAADLAIQTGRYDAAFVIYAGALSHAQGTSDFPLVREVAGEYLYRAATSADRLRPVQVIALEAELRSTNSPLVMAMVGRAMLINDNLRLAQLHINQALRDDDSLAEIHLVNGELLAQQRNPQEARREWEMARNAPDAPRWVRDRAAELLNTLDPV